MFGWFKKKEKPVQKSQDLIDDKVLLYDFFKTDQIDAIGVVDGHLELLLIDPLQWEEVVAEQTHLEMLQEKINNYLIYLQEKQYVNRYGDDFTEKVIKLTFQYSPTNACLAFLVDAQKTLQSANISLTIIMPDEPNKAEI